MDHFERLGLPRRFSVDLDAIEREYLARSRKVHPDFHGLGPEADRRASLEQSASLNEAYLTLKDPFRRADYLLGLLGGPTARNEKNLDQSFLMEMMELRERIEQAKASRNDLDGLESDLVGRLDVLKNELALRFARLERLPGTDPTIPAELVEVRRILNAAKTLNSLLRDLRFD